jgi:hypothetical protein
MKTDTVSFMSSELSKEMLCYDTDIVVNSDVTRWIESEGIITINTWNYRNTRFGDFKSFSDKWSAPKMLRKSIDNFILATQSVNDMAYSVSGKLVF